MAQLGRWEKELQFALLQFKTLLFDVNHMQETAVLHGPENYIIIIWCTSAMRGYKNFQDLQKIVVTNETTWHFLSHN